MVAGGAGANLRPGTWENYRIHVQAHIVPALGTVELQRLSPAQLNAFYRHLLTEVRAFLEHVHEDDLYVAWLLIATTGMRRGELAGLRWADVDLEAGRLSVRQPRVVVANLPQPSEPKSAQGRRSLALDPVTVAALRRHRARQLEHKLAVGARYRESGLVFTWPAGSPIHPRRLSRWFEQHARRADLPRIRLHDLRHSYASAALAAGVPAKVISERLATRPSPSPWTSTRTSCPAWTGRRPTRWPA